MAQRKSAPSASAKSGPTSKASPGKAGTTPKPTGRSGTAPKATAKAGTAPKTSARSGSAPKTTAKATALPGGRPPVKKKPGKSIVNQKQTPWGLIVTTVLIVVFAAGIVSYAVLHHKKAATTLYTQPEVAAAKSIKGLIHKTKPDHTHVIAPVKYDTSPPIGGNHSEVPADCSGTVYPNAIANENAVHSLEHGAVWITYRPGLAAGQVAALARLVAGVDHMVMSPYPGLRTNISLQSWNYQLFVDDASDPRIQQFIGAVRYNKNTTPEFGASCSVPSFKAHPSTFGHPIFTF